MKRLIIILSAAIFSTSLYSSALLASNLDNKGHYKPLVEMEKPSFKSFKDVKKKKKAFFDYFYPLIVNKNLEILKLRKEIKLTKTNSKSLNKLCKSHKIECKNKDYSGLLNYIQIIPPSLAMAQAANESAWGTSRFARLGNNYFGIWCFSKGCGIVPSSRSENLSHEVRKFKNAKGAVSYYVDNINRNHNYQLLRDIRKKSMNSVKLAGGLLSYSEKGQLYVNEIIEMVKYNKLKKYDIRMFKYLDNVKK